MSLFNVFDIAGSALTAQTVRLNVTASNLANAESVSGDRNAVYKAREPVFAALLADANQPDGNAIGVRIAGIVENDAPALARYAPDHPLADEKGYIYMPNVNSIEQMANMISASRSYQNNVEVINTSKQLLMSTLRMGG